MTIAIATGIKPLSCFHFFKYDFFFSPNPPCSYLMFLFLWPHTVNCANGHIKPQVLFMHTRWQAQRETEKQPRA